MNGTPNNIKPSKPELFCVQVGTHRAPSMNQKLELVYEARRTTTEIHGGGQFDYFQGRRTPLSEGTGTVSGVYPCCKDWLKKNSCDYFRHEADGVHAAVGARVPILFYRDYSCVVCNGPRFPLPACPESNCGGDCLEDCPPTSAAERDVADCNCAGVTPCGKFMWAWGSVTKTDNSSNVDDYNNPEGVDFGFEFILESPMIEASYSTWRFGGPLRRTDPARSTLENEAVFAEKRGQWWMPCFWNGCCDANHFYFRQLEPTNDESFFDPDMWEAERHRAFANQSFVIEAKGNYAPRTRMLITSGSTLTIKNDIGVKAHTFNFSSSGSLLYLDSLTGLAMEKNNMGQFGIYTRSDIPRLDFGRNVVTIGNGQGTVGVNPRWIN